MNDRRFYVYELIDPRTNIPFYVGKGSGNRDISHLQEAKLSPDKQVNVYKCNDINNIISVGLIPIVNRVHVDKTEKEAYELEELLIRQYGKRVDGTGILTNVADGGIGPDWKVHSKSVCQHTVSGAFVATYVSLAAAAIHTRIHKSTICAALRGRTELAAGYRWVYFGEKLRPYNNTRVTPVDQFLLTGEKISSFDSVQVAAATVDVCSTEISDCISTSRPRYTAGGYRWALKGETPKPLPKKDYVPRGSKEFKCYKLDGQFVASFSTIADAIKQTGANATGISDCCSGRKQTSGGFIWKRAVRE